MDHETTEHKGLDLHKIPVWVWILLAIIGVVVAATVLPALLSGSGSSTANGTSQQPAGAGADQASTQAIENASTAQQQQEQAYYQQLAQMTGQSEADILTALGQEQSGIVTGINGQLESLSTSQAGLSSQLTSLGQSQQNLYTQGQANQAQTIQYVTAAASPASVLVTGSTPSAFTQPATPNTPQMQSGPPPAGGSPPVTAGTQAGPQYVGAGTPPANTPAPEGSVPAPAGGTTTAVTTPPSQVTGGTPAMHGYQQGQGLVALGTIHALRNS